MVLLANGSQKASVDNICLAHTPGRLHRISCHKSPSLVKSRRTFCPRFHTNIQIVNSESVYQRICEIYEEKNKTA